MHTINAQVSNSTAKRLKVFCAENDLRVSWIVRKAVEDAAGMEDAKLVEYAKSGKSLPKLEE